jgi:hypothetical protein
MARALALTLALVAATAALGVTGAASAETWKPYSAISPKKIQWSYDADYAYRDKQSGRVVLLTAAGKVGAEPRIGPSGPGAADGAGAVVALDCKRQNMIFLSGFSPGQALDISDKWRSGKAQPVSSDPDGKALAAAVCPTAESLPEK